MKRLGSHIEKDRSGYITLRPETDEDMWHLYNIIQEGDGVKATADRRIQNITATGSTSSKRIKTKLKISVKEMQFYATAAAANEAALGTANSDEASSSQGASLSISGQVIEENDFAKMGAHHTLDLELNKDVQVTKIEWDTIAFQRVQEACNEQRGAEIGAIILGEGKHVLLNRKLFTLSVFYPSGTAFFLLLSNQMTIPQQRINMPIPRKRPGSTTLHEKGIAKFYDAVYQSLLRHTPYNILRAIIVASPGFINEDVIKYIFDEAAKTNNKPLLQARRKFLKVHVSSPHVHSLMEVMKSPEITSQLSETKFAREGLMLDKLGLQPPMDCRDLTDLFHKMLGVDEMRAWYGPNHVALAADRGAVGTLLISDALFRSNDPKERKKYVQLVESVRQKGAEVLIFSSMHESGQQLNQLTGIAAILTYPLDVEVVEAEERAEAEEKEKQRLEGLDVAQ